MQSGGGGSHGRNQTAPSSSSSSPSSSAVSNQLPFEAQQQLSLRNQQLHQQQQQQQRPLHGVVAGSNYAASSNAFPAPNLLRNIQFQDDTRNQGQQFQNPVHQVYLQMFAKQASQQQNPLIQQSQGKLGVINQDTNNQDSNTNSLKMHDLASLRNSNQPLVSMFQKPVEHAIHQRNDLKPPQNVARPMQSDAAANQLIMAQFQSWAMERKIDISLPSNANLLAQLLPMWQSARIAAMQKANESGSGALQQGLPSSSQQSETSHVPVSQMKNRNTPPLGSMSSSEDTNQMRINNPSTNMHPPQPSGSSSHITLDHSGNKTLQNLQSKQLQQSKQSQIQGSGPNVTVGPTPLNQGAPVHRPQQKNGFTKQQLHVLKAQILAFRRLKRGEGALPPEVLQAIVPPPLDLTPQQPFLSKSTSTHESPNVKIVEDPSKHAMLSNTPLQQTPSVSSHGLPKDESTKVEEKPIIVNNINLQKSTTVVKEPQPVISTNNKPEQNVAVSVKAEQGIEQDGPIVSASKGKEISTNVAQSNKLTSKNSTPVTKDVHTRKFHGPLFDFPCFTKKPENYALASANNSSSGLPFGYNLKDLLHEEGIEVLNKKRSENLKRISGLLAINLERKRIKPDLVVRLQIEEKKLRLLDYQARLREEVDQHQQEIMAMPDRPYRKFVRQCERQRIELSRQVQLLQKAAREKQLKSIFQWRKKLLEAHWAIRDARTTRNRGVAKYHERMLRDFSKRKDEDRNKRMEALKNNDVDRYRQMLLEQQLNVPGDASQRYAVLSSFLSQTEEYLQKLGGKITAAKSNQEVEEASRAAAAAARAQGLSEEEIRAAALCAGDEVLIRNRFSEMNAPRDDTSDNKYYNLAHAVNERVLRQPSMLRMGTLRDYQLVGLQWMLSLYNNKLNGILADEMGLGKTVQVMALIAYLMEFKGNYGPHLIIVPNAVLVNWKSELHNWLPSVSCIYYVGAKDQRARLFSHEVCAMKFNVLVTTYEFVMFDRSKLSKIDWKYIIIDEAQRMKDRESVLARDLDKYRCQRRLLLTGTPLQNDLKELWSLLNLLLPEVFDNKKAFHDWFSKAFQKDNHAHSEEEDDWLETEKKVIIIHRLHQILEPFMLRRRVEDVEGSLPPKISIVLRCRMSAIQGAIYDWIKSTGTIRVDPEDELRKSEKNPMYQVKAYKNLNNKCMELRKACNHPLLNYPYFNDYSKEFLVRSCGKLWILDRILIKLHRAGHRVLLFSTMTKLLDILEEYLQWRRLVYRRIDGTTSLEDRESAIVDFNSPGSDTFIFLLSIRAAGRGLNLQTADTVVIYDPDPNPQNEAQAVARAHRIGQKREVKVIYLEAVVDKFSSYQKEDEIRNGGTEELDEDDLAGKDRYIGSIESLIRNNIQQYKIDMADEVINAGCFDQRTTHEERRINLETLLHDEDRYQENVHDVPSLQEVNRMIARNEEEVELFDQMDEEFDWTEEMIKHIQVPNWLRAGSRELDAVIARLSKKPSKDILASSTYFEENEIVPNKSERRGRKKSNQKNSIYRELDDDEIYESDASSVERNDASSVQEEEIAEFEEEDLNGDVDMPSSNKDQSDEVFVDDGGSYELSRGMEPSSGSSSGTRKLNQTVMPSSVLSRKFGSLSALDAKPSSHSKRRSDELEEGEIAMSGDSFMGHQQSGSWNHDREDGEGEQVLQQPKLKRKRSMRTRPKIFAENNGGASLQHGHVNHDHDMQSRTDQEIDPFSEQSGLEASSNHRRRMSSNVNLQKTSRLSYQSSEDGKALNVGNANGSQMSDSMQRKCKNVISKLQRRISKDGYQIVPVLFELWKENENSSSNRMPANPLDLWRIDQSVENAEYNGVMDFIADFQSMLRNVVQYCKYSYEVKYEARKFHDLFFDIMKIAFPETDFREARNNLTFPSHGGASTSLPATAQPSKLSAPIQSKRQHKIIEPEPKIEISKPNPRGGPSFSKTVPDPLSLTHPGDLVICKKKRQDRRPGPTSPAGQARPVVGPTSSTNRGVKEKELLRPAQQTSQWASPTADEEVQWAKPVKKLRTDTGKRRPCHF